jgi:hypothetical protein
MVLEEPGKHHRLFDCKKNVASLISNMCLEKTYEQIFLACFFKEQNSTTEQIKNVM